MAGGADRTLCGLTPYEIEALDDVRRKRRGLRSLPLIQAFSQAPESARPVVFTAARARAHQQRELRTGKWAQDPDAPSSHCTGSTFRVVIFTRNSLCMQSAELGPDQAGHFERLIIPMFGGRLLSDL